MFVQKFESIILIHLKIIEIKLHTDIAILLHKIIIS